VAGEESKVQEGRSPEEEEAELAARLQEEIRNLAVSDHLLFMMQSLSALAVGRLGLSGEAAPVRDLEQSRLAIDAFRALMGVLEGVRPAGEMAAHRGMLSQLQLAYAAAVSAGDRPATPEGAEVSEAEAAEDVAAKDARLSEASESAPEAGGGSDAE